MGNQKHQVVVRTDVSGAESVLIIRKPTSLRRPKCATNGQVTARAWFNSRQTNPICTYTRHVAINSLYMLRSLNIGFCTWQYLLSQDLLLYTFKMSWISYRKHAVSVETQSRYSFGKAPGWRLLCIYDKGNFGKFYSIQWVRQTLPYVICASGREGPARLVCPLNFKQVPRSSLESFSGSIIIK
jgi:hypothetical protein